MSDEHGDDVSGLVHQLPDGRFILAFWMECSEEWYAVPVNERRPMSSSELAWLAKKDGTLVFQTREEAEAAAHQCSR